MIRRAKPRNHRLPRRLAESNRCRTSERLVPVNAPRLLAWVLAVSLFAFAAATAAWLGGGR